VSVQFGKWNFDGKPLDRDYLEKARALIAPYGPDDDGAYLKGNISILYHAFHTTKESRRETQPHISASGTVITWDGRLDNRAELIRQLRDVLTIDSTDVSIVAAAYEEWGTSCFAKLIGDWALSVWDPNNRSLILAKDPIGARHLYYSFDNNQVSWSTILDPLVLFAGRSFALNEEYIAGWLSFFPATHLTPYVGIHSVPPSSSVRLEPGRHSVRKYWEFDPGKRIRYRTDGEYEEHFRSVFAEAVRRRLRSDSPILAELSGGMDSSSIVCMADTIIARGAAEAPRLDTISYYDDSEPNWNERPYFAKIEEERGCTGCHIRVDYQESFRGDFVCDGFAATPATDNGNSEATRQFKARVISQGNRVLLSGTGGDEVTGGVPTPVPQLEDLFARVQLMDLAHQLKVWALEKRKPWFHLFFEAMKRFLPPSLAGIPEFRRPAPWMQRNFVKRHRGVLSGYASRVKLFISRPSFQENLTALEMLRRQLACIGPPADYEKRYPYLDRTFLEFMYAIPREQLVRPGQRRSLMRRSLVGIVPDQILNRKRKAFVARAPMSAIAAKWTTLSAMSRDMVSNSRGIVEPEGFREALEKIHHGQEVPIMALIRTIGVEAWLRGLQQRKLLRDLV